MRARGSSSPRSACAGALRGRGARDGPPAPPARPRAPRGARRPTRSRSREQVAAPPDAAAPAGPLRRARRSPPRTRPRRHPLRRARPGRLLPDAAADVRLPRRVPPSPASYDPGTCADRRASARLRSGVGARAVSHESYHVLGYRNEAQVECYGMQSIWFVANKLGASVAEVPGASPRSTRRACTRAPHCRRPPTGRPSAATAASTTCAGARALAELDDERLGPLRAGGEPPAENAERSSVGSRPTTSSATCSPTAGACWKPCPEKPVA